jgi:hypothetical protein
MVNPNFLMRTGRHRIFLGVFLFTSFCALLLGTPAFAQREHVPVDDPVYAFLKTMDVRGIIKNYHYAMLPLSRDEVARFLTVVDSNRTKLSPAENEYLDDFMIEFQFELKKNDPKPNVFLNFENGIGDDFADAFRWKRKDLYEYHDSVATLFVDGVANVTFQKRGGDTSQKVGLASLGGSVRGTIGGNFAYYALATNGSLISGDLGLAEQNPHLRSNYKLGYAEHKNFDFTEGYALYDNGWLSLELGRETTLWGTGYLDRMLLSGNAPPLDFVKLNIQYGSVKYQFIHGSRVFFPLDSTQNNRRYDTTVPAYVAMHRIEFDFLQRFRFGFSEMTVYGNQFPQVAYLNPFAFMKATENSLQNVDKSILGLDLEYHPIDNISAFAEILISDFSAETRGTGAENNKTGYHGGIFYADPFGLQNVNLILEYEKLSPFMYDSRTDVNLYTNRNIPLGASIPSNSDQLSLQGQWRPMHNLGLTGTIAYFRHGANQYDSTGALVPGGNYGGNLLDAERNANFPRFFLQGVLTTETIVTGSINYEPAKQWTIGVTGQFDHYNTQGNPGQDIYAGFQVAVNY